jgi:hypothetical protein
LEFQDHAVVDDYPPVVGRGAVPPARIPPIGFVDGNPFVEGILPGLEAAPQGTDPGTLRPLPAGFGLAQVRTGLLRRR